MYTNEALISPIDDTHVPEFLFYATHGECKTKQMKNSIECHLNNLKKTGTVGHKSTSARY